jgi:hypothetical protein
MVGMNKKKIALITLLILSASVIGFFSYWSGNSKASIWLNDEKEFSKPIEIVWRGEIISTMAGGSCIGMRGNFDNYLWAIACLSDINSDKLLGLEGVVTVTGKWLGISCAYKNTIFGECVPDINIEKIEQNNQFTR